MRNESVDGNYINNQISIIVLDKRDNEILATGFDGISAGNTKTYTLLLESGNEYSIKIYEQRGDGTGNYTFILSQCYNGHTANENWVTTKAPTCIDPGEKAQYCSVCGEIMKTEQVDAKGHTLGEWKIKVPATWISLGEKEAACTICGEVETAKIWTKVWILPVVILGAIAVIIGIINYFKAFKRR